VFEPPISFPELVPVFPLPEGVLFPRQILPLHMFEPRYRTMVADALAGEKLIAVALLRPNYEPHYFTSHAPIHRIMGVGRIVHAEQLASGKYNIILHGETRARVVEEFPGRPYRFARIETLETYSNGAPGTRERLRRELLAGVERHLTRRGFGGLHAKLVKAALPLGQLADVVATQLPVAGEVRQCLLAELDACVRTEMLLEQIRAVASVARHARPVEQSAAWHLN
jgi:hypothetical protein